MPADNTNINHRRESKQQTPDHWTVVFYDKQKDELGPVSITLIAVGAFVAFIALIYGLYKLVGNQSRQEISKIDIFR